MRTLQNARVLITGGLGMIGSSIARKAVVHGAQVMIVDALLPLYGGNPFNIRDIRDSIQFVKADIRDYEKIEKLVIDTDVIFHLAAQVSYVDSNKDPFTDLDINCRGHLNILEAFRKANKKAKVIFSSSRFVYGATERNPVDESHPLNCLSIYGIHKLAAERYCQFYGRAYGMRQTIFRIANPYGPGQQMRHSQYGIVNWFIRLALEGKPLTIYGDGSQKRDYIFIDDLAEAMVMAASTETTDGKVYNIGSGVGTAFVEMAQTIAAIIPNTKLEHVEWPGERYFVETGDYITDISKISRDTGWQPRTSLYDGTKRTVDYYAKYGKHYW
ncbi:MAG: NAD-dependent epimerase/dehydratase family protein [Deltaproteobacteria bacterium]|nr:NAD-dependent epimerase/dehydratase family protein [Deltaproteobacteria bacterium]